MSIEYAHEKLMSAVHAMATGAGDIRDRLGDAALVLLPLGLEDFPDGELRRSFTGIMDDLTFQPAAGNEGAIEAIAVAVMFSQKTASTRNNKPLDSCLALNT